MLQTFRGMPTTGELSRFKARTFFQMPIIPRLLLMVLRLLRCHPNYKYHIQCLTIIVTPVTGLCPFRARCLTELLECLWSQHTVWMALATTFKFILETTRWITASTFLIRSEEHTSELSHLV